MRRCHYRVFTSQLGSPVKPVCVPPLSQSPTFRQRALHLSCTSPGLPHVLSQLWLLLNSQPRGGVLAQRPRWITFHQPLAEFPPREKPNSGEIHLQPITIKLRFKYQLLKWQAIQHGNCKDEAQISSCSFSPTRKWKKPELMTIYLERTKTNEVF